MNEANAVAGPSRAPYDPDVVNVVMESKGVSGPEIIPTYLDEAGLKVVPAAFEHCQVGDLIALIASMLDRLISHNDRIPLTPTSLTRFHSRAPPTISVTSYLERISRYTNVEPCCLLILLPYVDKVCARLPAFTISSLTVHRFVIAGVSVGSKALSDAFCTNGRYARVGGVSIPEMNLLEKEFCEAIDWRLTTTGAVLHHYYSSLVRSHPEYRLPTVAVPPTIDAASVPIPALPLVTPTADVVMAHSPSTHAPALAVSHAPSPSAPATTTPSGSSSLPISMRPAPPLVPAPDPRFGLGGSGSASNLPSPIGLRRIDVLSPTSTSYADEKILVGGLEAALASGSSQDILLPRSTSSSVVIAPSTTNGFGDSPHSTSTTSTRTTSSGLGTSSVSGGGTGTGEGGKVSPSPSGLSTSRPGSMSGASGGGSSNGSPVKTLTGSNEMIIEEERREGTEDEPMEEDTAQRERRRTGEADMGRGVVTEMERRSGGIESGGAGGGREPD